ncbi:MAG: DUF2225 domain-containing protein [Fibrobacteria bacterium]|nr:DUF2225 domain-containing protein [Fibrobacteria bacterium]
MAIGETLLKKKLLVLLNNNEDLVTKYLQKFGKIINIKYIKQLKEEESKKSTEPLTGMLQDPLFVIKVRCPVCKMPDLDCYELKAKSQIITYDKFLSPMYEGAPEFKTVDYSKYAVTVCPRCLFASPDKKDFITHSLRTKTEIKSQLGPMILQRLEEELFNRKDFLSQVENIETYFSVPRNPDATVMSYKMAIQRAQVEIEMELPASFYKAGAYALKIAHILRKEGGAEEEALNQALGFLTDCFTYSNVPQDVENQVIYLISALNLRLGNDKKCNEYIRIFDKLKSEIKEKQKTNPQLKMGTLEKWERSAKNLWEDREQPDLWNH